MLPSIFPNNKSLKPLTLGRLSIKEEAAGKARIFAITDSITQTVMKPLHDKIFSILRDIPMDGTFNQLGPINRLVSLHKSGELGNVVFYSYDLSAATDRLPIKLQSQILSVLLGETYSSLWQRLLTDRDWILRGKNSDTPYRYTVGQPMGALSS